MSLKILRYLGNRGFTLIELLVAITVFSIAISLVTYAFRQSINIVKFLNFPYAQDLQKISRFRDTLTSTFFYMTQDDTTEDPDKVFSIYFNGSQKELSFVTTKPMMIKNREIVLVHLKKEKDSVFLEEFPVFDRNTDYKTLKVYRKTKNRLILFDNVKDFSLSYIKNNRELNEIKKDIPDAVRITITYKDSKEKSVYIFKIKSNAFEKKEIGASMYGEY